jgi:ELWxxDGT repeat protein
VATGFELWKSDGTTAGTVLVKEIRAAGADGGIANMMSDGTTLYFTANDGTNGTELWKSDGTSVGTVMVTDINPGSSGSGPAYLANVNGTIYFSADDGVNGTELWKSDGTAAGTMLVKDIYTGSSNAAPANLTNVNGTLYFSATDAINGSELWKSDGTSAGTELVKDINPGSAGSRLSAFLSLGSKLLFSADDGANGIEPWVSNGTSAGTRLIQDASAGNPSSDPYNFTISGSFVYASMQDESNGRELWVATLANLIPVKLLSFDAKLAGSDGLLNWVTTSEVNTASYIIERSTDGRDFKSVGTVAARNLAGNQQYAFTDPGISVLGSPVVYYRLKMMDADGRQTYSRIIALNINSKEPVVMIYPNPSRVAANLMVSLIKKDLVTIRISNQAGQVMSARSVQLAAGCNTITLPVNHLAAGIYNVSISSGDLIRQVVLVKE